MDPCSSQKLTMANCWLLLVEKDVVICKDQSYLMIVRVRVSFRFQQTKNEYVTQTKKMNGKKEIYRNCVVHAHGFF